MKLTLTQLLAFLCLEQVGSFTLAAEQLGVSQPTLSRTIRQVEQIVGAKLVDRDTRNISLTRIGTQFLPIARRLVGEFEAAGREVAELVHGRRGRLTIAALPSVSATLLPGAIARLQASYPELDVVIRDSLSDSVLELVAEGGADVGLTVRPSPGHRLLYKPLLSDRFCLVSNGSAAIETGTGDWRIFGRLPFIAMAPSSSVRAMTDAAFLQAGMAVEPRYQCAYLSTVGGLLAAGVGITALPQLAIALLANRNLTVRPLARPTMTRSIGVVTLGGHAASPGAKAFFKALVEEAGALEDTRPGWLAKG